MNRRPTRSDVVFEDLLPEEVDRPELNPYLKAHREFGWEILPASDAPGFRGRWQAAFQRPAPLHLELGCGNGFYLAGIAAMHPEWNLLGLEVRYKRTVQTASKVRAAGVSNARVIRYSWFFLDNLFQEGELSGVHINFPDPWSKNNKQAHNRIFAPVFGPWLARALQPGGVVRLKTDFATHVDELIAATTANPDCAGCFEVVTVTHDLAATGAPWEDEIMTGYQKKFQSQGIPTHAALLRRTDAPAPPAPPEEPAAPSPAPSEEPSPA